MSFIDDLARVGLPIAGGIVGGAIGGPAGAAIGSGLGQVGSGALFGQDLSPQQQAFNQQSQLLAQLLPSLGPQIANRQAPLITEEFGAPQLLNPNAGLGFQFQGGAAPTQAAPQPAQQTLAEQAMRQLAARAPTGPNALGNDLLGTGERPEANAGLGAAGPTGERSGADVIDRLRREVEARNAINVQAPTLNGGNLNPQNTVGAFRRRSTPNIGSSTQGSTVVTDAGRSAGLSAPGTQQAAPTVSNNLSLGSTQQSVTNARPDLTAGSASRIPITGINPSQPISVPTPQAPARPDLTAGSGNVIPSGAISAGGDGFGTTPVVPGADGGPGGRFQQAPGGDVGFRSRQVGLADLLQGQAEGTAPSLADQVFRNAADRNLRQQLALAATGRGQPGALRQAQLGAGQFVADTAGQAAAARIQEQRQAQSLLGQLAGQARGQDLNVALANQRAVQGQGAQNLGGLLQLLGAQRQAAAGLPTVSNTQQIMGGALGALDTFLQTQALNNQPGAPAPATPAAPNTNPAGGQNSALGIDTGGAFGNPLPPVTPV